MTEIPFKDLPLYSYDYDADYPPVARDFKQAIADVDALLFVTPEYNSSIPGGLKNAIEAYIHFTPDLISDDGQVTNEATEKFLRNYMLEFHAFIVRVEKALAPNE